MRSEDEEMADAELWWEWNQRHLPLDTARFLDYTFGFLGGNRFHTGQPIVGAILLAFYAAILALVNIVDVAWGIAALPVLIHEWVTLKPRTKLYNHKLWLELVEKWNPETDLEQPAGT